MCNNIIMVVCHILLHVRCKLAEISDIISIIHEGLTIYLNNKSQLCI